MHQLEYDSEITLSLKEQNSRQVFFLLIIIQKKSHHQGYS